MAALVFVPRLCTLRFNIRSDAATVELNNAHSFHAKFACAVLNNARNTALRAAVLTPVVCVG